MLAGSVGVAFGVEYRKEKSSFEALPITAQLGSLGIDPDSDTSGSATARRRVRRTQHSRSSRTSS